MNFYIFTGARILTTTSCNVGRREGYDIAHSNFIVVYRVHRYCASFSRWAEMYVRIGVSDWLNKMAVARQNSSWFLPSTITEQS